MRVGAGQLVASVGLMATSKLAAGLVQVTATEVDPTLALALLPIHTTMTPEKTTQQVTFTFEGHECKGYEIHQGVSDTNQAILQTDHCIGTYIHGFLDNAPVIEHLLSNHTSHFSSLTSHLKSYAEYKDEQYNRLADHVRQYVDIDRIYRILSEKD